MATQSETKTNEMPTKQTVKETKNVKQSDLPWWLQPEVIEDEDKKVDESLQNESDIPLAPVTFNFVGIRPSKLHVQNNQISTISLNASTDVSCVQIKFAELNLSDTVQTLKQSLFAQFDIPQTRKSLLIYYGHTKLSKDDEILYNYGITDHSVFLCAIYDNINTGHEDKYIHATNESTEEEICRSSREQQRTERDLDAVKRRLKRIQDLKNGIKPQNTHAKSKKNCEISEVMTLKKLLKKHRNTEMRNGFDVISQEKDVSCVKLPVCGHLLSKDSLYQFTASQYLNREPLLKCPHTLCGNGNELCNQSWDYPLIKQCLLPNPDTNTNGSNYENDIAQYQSIVYGNHQLLNRQKSKDKESESSAFDFGVLELLSARNTMELAYDLQKCTQCKTLLYRNQRDNNFVCKTECPLCVEKESPSVFCWGCNSEWSDGHMCDTQFKANTMEILSKCKTKKVGPSPKCPSIRACPKCYQLITHVSACKHMKCSFCKTNFCFICLKPMEKGNWQCGGYSDSCPTHKRQNYKLLPKLNASFAVF